MLQHHHLVSRFIIVKSKLSFPVLKTNPYIYRIIYKCIENEKVSRDKHNEPNHDNIPENYRKFNLLQNSVRKNYDILKIKKEYKIDCIL